MASIDVKYHEILRRILDEGVDKGDRTGTGTSSIFSHTLEYDMKDGFPLLTTKKMFTKGIITELLWFLNGDTSLRGLVEQGNNIWVGDSYKKYFKENAKDSTYLIGVGVTRNDFIELIKTDDEFNKKWGDLGPIYGKQWVNWTANDYSEMKIHTYGINQIQNAIDMLNNNPDGRRIMVSAWNPADIPDMILPPCHWAFELYTEELTHQEWLKLYANEPSSPVGNLKKLDIPKRKISLKWHQRSCDSFLGIPFNIASYALLLEMFAQQVNMVPHKLIGDLSNVHIYKNHIDQVKEQLSRDVNTYSSPILKLNKANSIFDHKLEDFEIIGYESYKKIVAPLSN